jgi:putative peptidoglycan lipid II flippase
VGFLFISPWFTEHVLATKYSAAQQILTINYARIVFFSLIGLGPFAVLQGALYAQKEFGWTALAAAAYHVGIIIGAAFTAIVGNRFFGTYGIAFGVILGSVGEIALLIPGMRRLHLRYMFVLDLKHPALRKIFKLYVPIAFSFFATSIFGFLDQFFATQTPCASVTPLNLLDSCGAVNFTAMGEATFLIQFPGGLVASALSFAILPTLTGYIREGNIENFKSTLLLGFRLGLLLMIPAAAGFEVLGLPIIKLIFEHGKVLPYQSIVATSALRNYAYQLPFVAIDQLLIVAFYARKNTLIPVSIGIVSILGYLAVALPFWSTIGMPALAFANAVQNSLHAVLLLIILRIVVGPLHLGKMVPATLKILFAAAMMILVAWGLQLAFAHVSLFSLDHLTGRVLTVVVVGGISAAVYFGVAMLLKVEEVGLLKGAVMAKLGKR